jgi:hypothetical protein
MSRPVLKRLAFVPLAACVIFLVGSCHPNSEEHDSGGDEDPKACQTSIDDTATSPAPGALTLQGHFYEDETVILGFSDPVTGNPRTVFGTPASNRSSFTLTGLPSGTRTYLISLSCGENGSHIYASNTYTVQ